MFNYNRSAIKNHRLIMKNKISIFILMLISAVSSKAATLSETIDGFFKPIVDNYLVPVIF